MTHDRPPTHDVHDNETNRLEAFSDGVFAIAITLLILEIRVPDIGPGESLAAALRHLWPSYIAYATSFALIGIIWANHHSLFRLVHRADHLLIMLNLALLLCVSFLPFPTALVARFVHDTDQESTAVAAYGISLTVLAIFYNWLWFYVVRNREHLMHTGVNEAAIRHRSVRFLMGPLLYGVSVPLAFVSPWISIAIYIGLALLYIIPTGD
jgi:uncharacterized membrane protein